jgi:uncharacterized membrane protein (UPF0127 family)
VLTHGWTVREADRLNKLLVGMMIVLIVASLSAGYLYLQPAKTVRIMVAGVILSVELADTPDDQRRGLSGRDSMPPDHGMLFIFDQEAAWGFWMKDMKFSLDIIWFNSGKEVVFVEENLRPCDPQYCPVYTPSMTALYVLEVNAGFVHSHNLAIEATFAFV